jgi:hypothetical protein
LSYFIVAAPVECLCDGSKKSIDDASRSAGGLHRKIVTLAVARWWICAQAG